MDYQPAIQSLQVALTDLSKADLPAFIGELERLKALTWHRLMSDTHAACHPSQSERLLTMKDVANLINIPISCAYALTRQGKLRSIRTGVNDKYVRVRPEDLEEYKNRMNGPRLAV